MKELKILGLGLAIGMTTSVFHISESEATVARIKADKVLTAQPRKSGAYVRDGLITGGDRAIDDVIVLDVRHAIKGKYERIVLDLEGNRSGVDTAIERPPYYHVAVSPDMNRVEITVWGKPKLAFSPKKVLKSFNKSKLIEKVELFPLLEKDRWTFVLTLKEPKPVEVFELSNPVRVIVDFRK